MDDTNCPVSDASSDAKKARTTDKFKGMTKA